MRDNLPALSPDRAGKILRDVESRWNAAANPLVPARMATVYTRTASFFGGLPDLYTGEADILAYFSSYRDLIASMTLTLRDGGFVHRRPNLILFQGFADFTFDLVVGSTSRNALRATLALVPDPEGWKIALHHFSPPPEVPPVPYEG